MKCLPKSRSLKFSGALARLSPYFEPTSVDVVDGYELVRLVDCPPRSEEMELLLDRRRGRK